MWGWPPTWFELMTELFPCLIFSVNKYWCQNNSTYHKPRYLYWTGLEKYHSCIFGYISINGWYSSSVCSIYKPLGVKVPAVNLEHFYCLSVINNPLTISNLACFSFWLTHHYSQLLFKEQKECCWKSNRFFFVLFVCIVFLVVLSVKCFSGGFFFWRGGCCRSVQTTGSLTAGMPFSPGMCRSLHVAYASPLSPRAWLVWL